MASYAFNSWVRTYRWHQAFRETPLTCLDSPQFQVVFFKASDAPKFQKGSSLILAFCVLLVLFTTLARYLQVRDQSLAVARHASGAADLVSEAEDDKKLDPEDLPELATGTAPSLA